MTEIKQLLKKVIDQPQHHLSFTAQGDSIAVTFPNGRCQQITITSQDSRYILTSVVLKQTQVEQIGRAQALTRLWQHNREVNVVAFSLDGQGRLIGQITQVAKTTDLEELAFYIEILARECDRFEYVLSGQDLS